MSGPPEIVDDVFRRAYLKPVLTGVPGNFRRGPRTECRERVASLGELGETLVLSLEGVVSLGRSPALLVKGVPDGFGGGLEGGDAGFGWSFSSAISLLLAFRRLDALAAEYRIGKGVGCHVDAQVLLLLPRAGRATFALRLGW